MPPCLDIYVVSHRRDRPSRAFAVYLASKDPQVYGVVLGFTTDDYVVFGLSVDDPQERADRLAFAKELLQRLALEFDAEREYVAIEEGAPHVGAHLPPDGDRILFSWSRAN